MTRDQLFNYLKPRLGKKKARYVAFGGKLYRNRTKELIVHDGIGDSLKLKDLRILRYFGCVLSVKQQWILANDRYQFGVEQNVRKLPRTGSPT